MANDARQKIKLLKIMEILRQDTDEQHPLTTAQLAQRINNLGISCDRRTLGLDIAFLNSQGYEVMTVMKGHSKAYYVDDRSFSVPEIKILMDAVQAANFITPEKTAELSKKLAALGGSHQAELLNSNLVCFNTRKHTNEKIYYNVQSLEEALRQKKKVSFSYFDLDEYKQKAYRKSGQRYIVEPIALIYNEDNYYLLSYSSKYKGITTYRVDRMEIVNIEDEDVTATALEKCSSLNGYTEQVFKMYGGRHEQITIYFEKALLGAIYDKFGEQINISSVDTDTFRVTVAVQISRAFWGWLFQFSDQITAIYPERIREKYLQKLTETMETIPKTK